MPACTIYEQLNKLREAIRELHDELPSTSSKLQHLEQTFTDLEAIIQHHFEGSESKDFIQRFEAEMAKLMAPFNESLKGADS